MNEEINRKELKDCLISLADAMRLKPLSNERAEHLIDHVLYDQAYDGVKGKNAWACFKNSLLTERELRDLLMAHSATKISRHNRENEQDCRTYLTEELCNRFEYALLGKVVIPSGIDVLDPREEDNEN